jgi:phage shock protein A
MKSTKEVNNIIKNAKKIALIEEDIRQLRLKKKRVKGKIHKIDSKISTLHKEMKTIEARLELTINA